MAEERRRRRGRRRGRRQEGGRRPEPTARGRRGQPQQRREREAERAPAVAPASVSPLAFWRRRRPRTAREQPLPRQTFRRFWRRLTGFYFPPWVPVAFVMVVVFGILGALFFTREAAGAPRIGRDHWHAAYQIFICGQRQPHIPTFPGGVHTHADGYIHIHPTAPYEEGAGARLIKFFEYGGGKLSSDELQVPGQAEVYKSGDQCQGGEFDGQTAVIQVFVNGELMEDFDRYIPQDGDTVRIVYGPAEAVITPGPEGTPVPETPWPTPSPVAVARTITIEAGDRGIPEVDSFFNPNTFTIKVGETVKLDVRNTGSQSHNLRITGLDRQYETDDDLVSDPLIIKPGETGTLTVRIEEAGRYSFRCDIHPQVQRGILTVEGTAEEEEPTPTPTPSP